MGRAPCCDKAKVKRGPWSPDEDAVLISYVEMHGTGGSWISLPLKAGLNRCGKSCRLRWLNYLRPDIKHGGFNEQEDMIICTLYKNIGSRWSIIASHLPGRTDNDVKNYWNTKLKKKIMEEQIPIPTIQSKDNGIGDFSIASFDPNSGYEDSHRFFMELLQTDVVESPDANGIVTGFLSRSNDSSSVASSSITMENSGGIDYVKWFAEGSSGADDLFLSELGLEPLFGECFDGNGSTYHTNDQFNMNP